jgi:hypothetical protein
MTPSRAVQQVATADVGGQPAHLQVRAFDMEIMLSDNARRFLCRAGFLALCALPTLLCLKTVLFPVGRADWSIRLQQQFGVINRIGQVRAWSPQRTDFGQLTIGAGRFSTRLQVDAASWQSLNDGKLLYMKNVTGSVAAFWDCLDRMIETIAWSGKSDRPVRIHIGTMNFLESEDPAGPRSTWHDVRLAVHHRGQVLSATFVTDRRSAAWSEGQPAGRLERTVRNDETVWFVDATGFRIPGWVLQPIVPPLRAVNGTAELADVQAMLSGSGNRWSGEFSGWLLDVDLQEVMARQFGNSLDGRAVINVQSARIVNNRLVLLEGDLHSPSGMIGSRLLHASQQALGMQIVEPYGQQAAEPYGDLRLGFRIDRDRLEIRGMPSGAVLNDAAGNRMLIARHGQTWPVASLIQLVSWPREPLQAGSAALARHLVISPVDPQARPTAERTARSDEVGQRSYFNR